MTHTIQLNTNGGTWKGADSLTVRDRAVPGIREIPFREGCSFAGWYYDEACTKRCRVFADPVTEDLTLYAGWEPAAADYTEDFLAFRKAYLNFLSYNDASLRFLTDTDFYLSFGQTYSGLLAMAQDPAASKNRKKMEQMRYAVSELVRIHPDGYRMTPLWPDGNMPQVQSCIDRPECPQACLEDDPDYVPVIYDMRLPEPEMAKGTVILSPSVRAGAGELLYPARKWQAMGYNCFAVGCRFNTRDRKGGPGEPDPDGFVFCHSYPEELLDVQRAIRWVKFHADDLGVDPLRLVTLGFSKGNCAHYIAADLFDLSPEAVRFEKMDGTFEQILPGYVPDAIDAVPADVAVNIYNYGDMMLTKDGRTPIIRDSRIYTKDSMDAGHIFPACYFLAGNLDRIGYPVYQGFAAHNQDPDRLYDIPYEVHIYDGVPHGVCIGDKYPNFFSTWENADRFCMKHMARRPEKFVLTMPWDEEE